jgi:hypothetical protein
LKPTPFSPIMTVERIFERKLFVKTPVLGFLLTAVLMSCASAPFPEPERISDSLVIGAFSADFPDGYKADTVRFAVSTSFTEGVRLYFHNISQHNDFYAEVDGNGYYHFLSNGTDEFLLTSFSYTKKIATMITLISGEINIHIENVPGSLLYLGHTSFIFSNPQEGRKVQKLETYWNRIALLRYIHTSSNRKLCWWMACRVVENRFEVLDEYSGEVNVYPATRPYRQRYIEPFHRPIWPVP